jgi:hypothetical protein
VQRCVVAVYMDSGQDTISLHFNFVARTHNLTIAWRVELFCFYGGVDNVNRRFAVCRFRTVYSWWTVTQFVVGRLKFEHTLSLATIGVERWKLRTVTVW